MTRRGRKRNPKGHLATVRKTYDGPPVESLRQKARRLGCGLHVVGGLLELNLKRGTDQTMAETTIGRLRARNFLTDDMYSIGLWFRDLHIAAWGDPRPRIVDFEREVRGGATSVSNRTAKAQKETLKLAEAFRQHNYYWHFAILVSVVAHDRDLWLGGSPDSHTIEGVRQALGALHYILNVRRAA